jgi:hypothetical protein
MTTKITQIVDEILDTAKSYPDADFYEVFDELVRLYELSPRDQRAAREEFWARV